MSKKEKKQPVPETQEAEELQEPVTAPENAPPEEAP